MGTDISIFVEVKKDGKWVGMDQWESRNKWWRVPLYKRVYQGQNYRLFAVLADVRNSWDIPPIHKPNRGLPKDMSEEVSRYEWGDIAYNGQSWATLKELQEYPWDMEVCFEGMLMANADAATYKTSKQLPEYGWITENDRRFRNLDLKNYTHVDVFVSVGWLCQNFVDNTMPKLAAFGEPEDVRIVYGFD